MCEFCAGAADGDGGTDDDDDRWRDSPPLMGEKPDCAMCNHVRVTAIMVPRKLACFSKKANFSSPSMKMQKMLLVNHMPYASSSSCQLFCPSLPQEEALLGLFLE